MGRAAVVLVGLLLLAACATTSEGPQGQGGAGFRAVKAGPVPLPAEALYDVCWPDDATPQQRVTLVFQGAGGIAFSALEGASNSTARCMREIATAYPWVEQPAGTVVVAPPVKGPSAWAALAWVRLLSASRYGSERGELDPAPLVAACLARGGGARPGTRFEVSRPGQPPLHVVPAATTDSERCVEAVLGATAWPSTRPFSLGFDDAARGAPQPAGDVGDYFAPPGDSLAPLDPVRVKETLALRQPAVAACWDEALARRVNIGGGRSVRFRVGEGGAVQAAWVAGNVGSTPDTAADLRLDRCLLGVVRATRFEGGPGDGVYTWVFASRG